MSTEIQALLDRLEIQHGIRIPYACESGSRAWGFASPDSDYDIRFIFVRPESSYLSVQEGADSIDLPLEGELDAGGWDVRKAAKLLGRSNGALIEWLHSPVVYRSEPGFRERWQSTARTVFSPRAAHDHYHGLAKQMVMGKLESDTVRAKDYLYALRSLLCARWISAGKGIPPVAFAELVPTAPGGIQDLIPELLEHKARTAEGERMSRIAALDDFLREALAETCDLPRRTAEVETLDRLLRSEVRRPAAALAPADFTLDRVRQPDL
jgi:predicted nucleotidyltransferase